MAYLTRQIAIRAAVGLIGLSLLGAGLVFLLRALWLALLPIWGPMATALWMGGGMALVGLLTVYLAFRRPRVAVPPPVPQTNSPLTTLVGAFAQGYGVAQAMKSQR
ncbi:hypothetical protein LCM17_15690 [Cereibacter sphaeroides]|nr:hypothetical protein [Cereibacter sphaeroides]